HNLRRLAEFFEQVRHALGDVPVLISSGYRCPRLNQLVGGQPDSAHLQGLAADFKAPAYGTPCEICQHLVGSALPFDQLILERIAPAIWV
ncbi:D-Ala-D-Ala carboxypeptidase family metallohydrolase, partial [Undibacterium sp. 10I3]